MVERRQNCQSCVVVLLALKQTGSVELDGLKYEVLVHEPV